MHKLLVTTKDLLPKQREPMKHLLLSLFLLPSISFAFDEVSLTEQYICIIENGDDYYEGYGKSEEEAKAKSIEACGPEIFCLTANPLCLKITDEGQD